MGDGGSGAVTVEVQILPHGEGLGLPEYATQLSAGVDLQAAIRDTVILDPGARALVPSGLALGLPAGMEAQVRPRSGLALRHGITVLNSPGTIDADYRGEVGVILINHGEVAFEIERGMRIAQLVVAPVTHVRFETRDKLSDTPRGIGGFGSTGTR